MIDMLKHRNDTSVVLVIPLMVKTNGLWQTWGRPFLFSLLIPFFANVALLPIYGRPGGEVLFPPLFAATVVAGSLPLLRVPLRVVERVFLIVIYAALIGLPALVFVLELLHLYSPS